MSDIEWDADDFEPPPNNTAAVVVSTDKWAGEDEDDESRDDWDDEDEEKRKEKEAAEGTTAPVKNKKKKLIDKIAEKESQDGKIDGRQTGGGTTDSLLSDFVAEENGYENAKQQDEIERRRKELEEKSRTETPEAKLEEKLRLQKVQEDADLELANDLIGGGGSNSATEEDDKLLDEIDLSDRDGLESFRKSLVTKIRSTDRLEKRPFFVNFVEDLSRDLCQNLEMEEVKRVSSVLNSLYNEKVKASKPKNKKKAANKPKLNVTQGAIIDIGNDFGAEYDDFM